MDRHEIEANIESLERGSTTWSNVEKLALLYTVRDNLDDKSAAKQTQRPSISESYVSAPESEFAKALQMADFDKVLRVLDEHMDIVRIIYPKEYDAVLRKIRE